MKHTIQRLFAIASLLAAAASYGQISTAGLQPVARDQLPRYATYWLAYGPNGHGAPPLPCPPGDMPDAPIYSLGNGQFAVDDGAYRGPDRQLSQSRAMLQTVADESEGDSFSPTYGTNDLWLQLTLTNSSPDPTGTNLSPCIWVNTPNPESWFDLFYSPFISVTNGWWWIGRGLPGQLSFMVTNSPGQDTGFFVVGTSNGFDSATGITSAYLALVGGLDTLGRDIDNDGLPDSWEIKYFGDLSQPGSLENLAAYSSGRDPNVITFTIRAGYQSFNSPQATAQFDVLSGAPSYSAVLVNSSNRAGAVWLPYTGVAAFSLGPTDGVFSVQFGLKGRAPDSIARWVGTSMVLDRAAPAVFLTAPAATNFTQPVLSVCGYSTEPLWCVTYTLSNAAGLTPAAPGSATGPACGLTNYFELPDLTLSEGPNLVSLSLSDSAGNSTTTNLAYFLDRSSQTNPPSLQIFWPLDGARIAAAAFDLRGLVGDSTAPIAAQISASDGTTNFYSGWVGRGGCFRVEGLPMAAGTNWLTITATTLGGNSSVTNLTLVKGDVLITITGVTPDPYYRPTVTVTGTISDDGYKVWVNGVGTLPSAGFWTAQNVPLATDGSAVFTATAIPLTDNNGNGTPAQTNINDLVPANPASTNAAAANSSQSKDSEIKLIQGEWHDTHNGTDVDWGCFQSDFHWTFSETNGGFAEALEKYGPLDPVGQIESGFYWLYPDASQFGVLCWTTYDEDGNATATTNSWQGPPPINWPQEWSINGPMASGSVSGHYYLDEFANGENSLFAKVKVVLRTGGKPNSTRWTLFEIGGSATEMYMNDYGAFVKRTNDVPPQTIFVPCLGTNLEANGCRCGVLKDNKEVEITLKAHVPYYFFNPTARRLEVPLTFRGSGQLTQHETNNVGYQADIYDGVLNLLHTSTLGAGNSPVSGLFFNFEESDATVPTNHVFDTGWKWHRDVQDDYWMWNPNVPHVILSLLSTSFTATAGEGNGNDSGPATGSATEDNRPDDNRLILITDAPGIFSDDIGQRPEGTLLAHRLYAHEWLTWNGQRVTDMLRWHSFVTLRRTADSTWSRIGPNTIELTPEEDSEVPAFTEKDIQQINSQ